MEALEIEGQTDQTPLTRRRRDPTQGELAEAEHLFDDADYRLDRAFAYPIDRFAQRGSQLVGHLDLCAGVLRWWIRQRREALLPTGMMGITTRGDVGLDAAFGTCGQGGRAKVASIQRRRLGRTDLRWNGRERGFSFLAIVGMIGEGPSHDEQTGLIHRHLRVIILLEARMGRAFHDARLRVGKVVLVAVARPWGRWARWATTRSPSRRALPLLALRHLGLILCLLGCCTFLGTSFQQRFSLRQPRQAILAPRDLVAHHQPIGYLWLLALFAQGKQFLDLSSQLSLHLSQPFVADRFALGGIGMHLGSIQADGPQFQYARLLGQQEHLHEEVLQLGQEGAPKRGQRIVIGMQIAGDEAKGTASYVARSILRE